MADLYMFAFDKTWQNRVLFKCGNLAMVFLCKRLTLAGNDAFFAFLNSLSARSSITTTRRLYKILFFEEFL